MLVIPALRRQRQEDHKLKTSLSYIGRPYLKKKERLNMMSYTVIPATEGARIGRTVIQGHPR
jgi:hypothetical protein